MELIRKPSVGCFFCEYIHQEKDRENLILERGKKSFVILNRYPYNNGHLMVVPYEHTGDMSQLSPAVRSSLMEYTTRWQSILQSSLKAQGVNIGINIGKVAGAGVGEHVHIHIVPRWLGDVNFMPVVGDIKIINQSLDDLYEQLVQFARGIPLPVELE